MDVRLPNGTLLRNVPEGTTQEQLISQLKAGGHNTTRLGLEPALVGPELTRRSVQEEIAARDPNAVQRFFTGLGQGPTRAALALKDIFGGLSPEGQNLAQMSKEVGQNLGPWGTGGAIAGDVAMTAPAFGVTAAATRGLPLSVRALSQAATGAGVGATLTPENRGAAAIGGAVGGAGGEVVGSALTRGLVRPGAKANFLMEEGIEPSLGDIMKEGDIVQRGLGYPIRAIEGAAERLPLIGSKLPLTKMQLEAREGAKKFRREVRHDVLAARKLQKLTPEEAKDINQVTTEMARLPTKPRADDFESALALGALGVPSYLMPQTLAATVPLTMFPKTTARLATGRTAWQQALERELGGRGLGPAAGVSQAQEFE